MRSSIQRAATYGGHMERADLDPLTLCSVLAEHGVSFLLVGGAAANMYGSTVSTNDLDLVPDDSPENLTRLSAALVALEAEVVGAGRVRHHPDGEWLRSTRTWNFRTPHGDLDVLFSPPGARPFDAMSVEAQEAEVKPGLVIVLAPLDDLIAMKKAAGRNKDLLAIPILEYLRDRKKHPLE